MPTVYFSPYLLSEKKRSITSSNLVSARQNCVARNCCVGAAKVFLCMGVFMILIHSFQFLLQLIEYEIN